MQAPMVFEEKRLYSLTKTWLGLFFFAAVINIAPLIPGWDNLLAEDQAQVLVPQIHTAYCSSHYWNRSGTPQSRVTTSVAVPLSVGSTAAEKYSSAYVVSPAEISPPVLSVQFSRFLKECSRAHFFHILGHPERGPPFLI